MHTCMMELSMLNVCVYIYIYIYIYISVIGLFYKTSVGNLFLCIRVNNVNSYIMQSLEMYVTLSL